MSFLFPGRQTNKKRKKREREKEIKRGGETQRLTDRKRDTYSVEILLYFTKK